MRVILLALVALLGFGAAGPGRSSSPTDPTRLEIAPPALRGRAPGHRPGDLQDRPVERLWDRPGAPGLRGLAGRAAYRRVQGLGQRLQRQLSEPGAARAAPGFLGSRASAKVARLPPVARRIPSAPQGCPACKTSVSPSCSSATSGPWPAAAAVRSLRIALPAAVSAGATGLRHQRRADAPAAGAGGSWRGPGLPRRRLGVRLSPASHKNTIENHYHKNMLLSF